MRYLILIILGVVISMVLWNIHPVLGLFSIVATIYMVKATI